MRKQFIQKYDPERERRCRLALANLTDVEKFLFMEPKICRITRNIGTAIGAIRKAKRFLEKDIDEQEQNND